MGGVWERVMYYHGDNLGGMMSQQQVEERLIEAGWGKTRGRDINENVMMRFYKVGLSGE